MMRAKLTADRRGDDNRHVDAEEMRARSWVGNSADLSYVRGRKSSVAAAAALANESAVDLYPACLDHGGLHITWWTGERARKRYQTKSPSNRNRGFTFLLRSTFLCVRASSPFSFPSE